MSAAAGAIGAALGLIVLEGAVKHPSNAGAGVGALTGVARRFLDPAVPAIPNLTSSAKTGTAANVGVSAGKTRQKAKVGQLPARGLVPSRRKVNVTAATSPLNAPGSAGPVLD